MWTVCQPTSLSQCLLLLLMSLVRLDDGVPVLAQGIYALSVWRGAIELTTASGHVDTNTRMLDRSTTLDTCAAMIPLGHDKAAAGQHHQEHILPANLDVHETWEDFSGTTALDSAFTSSLVFLASNASSINIILSSSQ